MLPMEIQTIIYFKQHQACLILCLNELVGEFEFAHEDDFDTFGLVQFGLPRFLSSLDDDFVEEHDFNYGPIRYQCWSGSGDGRYYSHFAESCREIVGDDFLVCMSMDFPDRKGNGWSDWDLAEMYRAP